MIETRTLTTEVEISPETRASILSTLAENGWLPSIFESEKEFMKLAGVEGKLDISKIRRPFDTYRRYPIGLGEVFFRSDDVYYVVANMEGGIVEIDGRRVRVRGERDATPTLEIGVISSNPEGLSERLIEFSNAIEYAVKQSLDGRKARHLTFDWKKRQTGTPRVDRIIKSDDSMAEFIRAKLIDEEIQAANVLSSKSARELLIELNQAGFARGQDVLNRRNKEQVQVQKALEALKLQGLICEEFLLECKRTGTSITRLKSRDLLEKEEVASLVCPSCGLAFHQERLSEGYSVAELGRRMSAKSHWMTVWLTDLLVKLGVPEDTILWNLSEKGEEVDLLVEFLGQLWIFELKAREFGAGDAYPLNYRQVRFRATKAIIVTTEIVSPDAKRVFRELQSESGLRRRKEQAVYIEGLDKAEEVLRQELSQVSLSYASNRLSAIGQTSGYELSAVIAARFGELIEIEEDEFEIPF